METYGKKSTWEGILNSMNLRIKKREFKTVCMSQGLRKELRRGGML